MEALAEVDQGDGIVVFADVRSAVMSAEMGVELFGERPDIRVLAAPFVEGILAAIVRAAGGATLDEVAAEALEALAPKLSALGSPVEAPVVQQEAPVGEARGEATVVNETGLHARPAALFVAEARKFDAVVTVRNGSVGPVSAASSIGLATLGAKKGDTLVVEASGPESRAAVDALVAFLESGAGE